MILSTPKKRVPKARPVTSICLRPTPRDFSSKEELHAWLISQNAEIAPIRDTPRMWQLGLISLENGYVSSTGEPPPRASLVQSCVERITIVDMPIPKGRQFLLRPAPDQK